MEHLLCVNFITLDNRMLFLVAAITDVEVEVSDVISTFRVDGSQALLELFIAHAMQSSEVIVVFQAVLFFTRSDVVTVIMLSAALINLRVTSQVIESISGVSRSTPAII
jgi:predicted amino acid racemase